MYMQSLQWLFDRINSQKPFQIVIYPNILIRFPEYFNQLLNPFIFYISIKYFYRYSYIDYIKIFY